MICVLLLAGHNSTAIGEPPALSLDDLEELRSSGCQRMLDEGRHDALIAATTLAIKEYPQFVQTVEQLITWRAKVHLAAGNLDDALAEAKRCFLFASIGYTDNAIALVGQVLEERSKKDAAEWRLEQFERSFAASSKTKSMISSVPIRDAAWDAAADQREAWDWYGAQFERSNLLLLSGRVDEATEAMERAYEIAPEEMLVQATEGVARCRKAQDLGVFRANEWIKQVAP